jgi:hypothetical protein
MTFTSYIRSESLICFSFKGCRTEGGGQQQGDGAEGGSAEPFIAGIVGTVVQCTLPDILS